jgi:MFS transporter, FHS family, Na+ dependent glucose transporter 1
MNSTQTIEPSQARSGKITRTAAYYIAFIALGLVGGMLGPILPTLQEHTRATISQISFVFSARTVGYAVGSILLGRLYDRLPGHLLLGGVLFGMAASVALAPIIPTLWLLFLVFILVGMMEGIVDVGGNTMLVWVHHPYSGPFMNGLHFFFGVGAFLAPIIISQVALVTSDSTRALWVLAVLMLPAALFVLRLRSPHNPALTQDEPAPKADTLLIVLIALLFCLFVGTETSYGGLVLTYATRLHLLDATTAAFLTSLFWGSLTVGRLLSIPIASRAQPRWILLADMLGCAASVLVVLAWPSSTTALWIGTIGFGLFQASAFPTLISYAEKRMAINAAITSYFFIGSCVGSFFVPALIGQLFDAQGPLITMVIILVCMLLNVIVFSILMGYSKRVDS